MVFDMADIAMIDATLFGQGVSAILSKIMEEMRIPEPLMIVAAVQINPAIKLQRLAEESVDGQFSIAKDLYRVWLIIRRLPWGFSIASRISIDNYVVV